MKEITVAEYSRKTGLSKKTIYGYIKKGDLSVIERRGKDNRPVKYILLENEVNEVNFDINPENKVNSVKEGADKEKPKEQPVGKSEKAGKKDLPQEREQYLLDEIASLKEQMKEKDRQILELAQKFADLAEQSNRIAEKAVQTTGQAQLLQAAEKQKPDVIASPKEDIGYKEPKEEEIPTGFFKKIAYWFTH